jgi:hypothetical protein
MAESFYLTVSSNASLDFYASNTTAKFRVQLPREVTLQGKYEFGLVELHYPCTFFNVREGQNLVDAYIGSNDFLFGLKPGYYASPTDLISATNQVLNEIGLDPLGTNSVSGYLEPPEMPLGKPHRLKCSETLGLQLGFEPFLPLCLHPGKHGEKIKDDAYIRQTATRYVDTSLGLPSMMLIYCDLAEPQLYSDVVTSVIRTVSIDKINYKYGNMACRTYERPIYIPVLKSQFDTIEIHIRESHGALMPFTYGTCTLTLHFRPCA